MGKISNFHPKYGLKLANNIMNTFGKPFFWLNTTTFFSHVGIIYYLIQFIALPYYQSANIDGQLYTEMSAIGFIPWTCKGFYAITTDLLPIFRRQKFYHLLFYISLGIVSCAILAFLPFSVVEKNPISSALLFFCFNVSSAASDLILEAKYIEIMQKNTNIRADLLTYARFCETVGQLLPTITIGIVADITDVRIMFYVFFPLLLPPLIPLFYGGLIDDSVPKHESNKINIKRFKLQWRLVLITGLQFFSAIGTIIVTQFGDASAQLIYTLFILFFINISGYFLLNLHTAKYFTCLFILSGFYFNIQGALDYYYTEECAIDGPQFEYKITNSLSPTFSTLASFLAIFTFQVIFYDWKFKWVYWTAVIIRMIFSFSDLALVNGWNRIIGIPDELIYLTGYSTMAYLGYMIISITNSYMSSKLSPKNFEATMFALLSSASHIGSTSASFFGAFLMDIFNIVTRPDTKLNIECNFDNLSYLIIIGHIIFPAFSLVAVYFLIPPIRLNEPYLRDYDEPPQAVIKSVNKENISESVE